MLRPLLAALAALVLVGVLSLLIVESRAVKEDYYIAHAARMRAIDDSVNDINAITQGAQAAFDEGRTIPPSITLAFARLAESAALLQQPTSPSIADSQQPALFAAYDEQVQKFIRDSRAFAERQNALAVSLRRLQEESPTLVKDLRRFDLQIQSQNAFALAIDTMEFAIGDSQSTPEQLASRIDTLSKDPTISRQAPGRLDNFISAANAIVEEHTTAKAALGGIAASTVADELRLLSAEVMADNRRIVSRAERARLLLAMCAVLLLLGAGYAMYRLQNSYTALNRSNASLAQANDLLEQRVVERTQELTEAIEELKESQVQLVQAEKMSSLGELVAGISHEINTPLWYLISNSSVVQERLAELSELLDVVESMVAAAKSRTDVTATVTAGLSKMSTMLDAGMKEDVEEAQDLVKDSIEGLEELTELAQSLKDFSRLDRAKQDHFNVNDGLNKTLLIVKNKIKNTATVHKHLGEVPDILCSPSQINQVFLNLIVNASDAIGDHGDIVMHTWSEDGVVGIQISDTGCGIPADDLAKVRDPFFTTKDVGKGTGLGLSIVSQIVESHHGDLTIESAVGKGTTVTVVFPIEPPAAADTAAAESSADENAADWAGDTNVVLDESAAAESPAADWAGDTNVALEDAAESPAATQSDAVEDWAGDTNVAIDESPAATAPAETEETDWAGTTSVPQSNEFSMDAVAENEEDALTDADVARLQEEYDLAPEDQATPAESHEPGSEDATVVADWGVDSDVVELFSANDSESGNPPPDSDPAGDGEVKS